MEKFKLHSSSGSENQSEICVVNSSYFGGTTILFILRGANPNLKMGKGGTVNRLEPEGPEFCDWNVGVWFRVAGWYKFITKSSGENFGVSRTFSLSFDDVQV